MPSDAKQASPILGLEILDPFQAGQVRQKELITGSNDRGRFTVHSSFTSLSPPSLWDRRGRNNMNRLLLDSYCREVKDWIIAAASIIWAAR